MNSQMIENPCSRPDYRLTLQLSLKLYLRGFWSSSDNIQSQILLIQ